MACVSLISSAGDALGEKVGDKVGERVGEKAFACLKRIELKKKVRLVGVRASNFEGRNQDDQQPRLDVPDELI